MARKESPYIQVLLGRNIRKVRNQQGLSQQKLAELSDVSTNYIGEIEIARKFPSASTLQKISLALGLKPYQLLFEDEEWHEFDRFNELVAVMQELKLTVAEDIERIIKEHLRNSTDKKGTRS